MAEISRMNMQVWKANFRRTKTVVELRALANSLAADAGETVTITATGMDGGNASGSVTGNKLEMLAAVEELLVKEHSNERLIKHKRTGKVIWEEDHGRAIHYGDASLIAFTGIDAMTGGKRSRMMSEVADGEALAAVDFEQPFTAAA